MTHIIAGQSPFRASDTPSRMNTLRAMYGTRGRMDTTMPASTSKPKPWTEKPDLVTSVHKVTQDLIDEHKLNKSLTEDWTPETFITGHHIDLTQTLTDVRKAIRAAVIADFRADLLSLYTEAGITDEAEQVKAHPPFDTLDEAIAKMSPIALRNMVGMFVAAARNKQHIDSLHKEQPKMDITKLDDVFNPAKTDDEVKAALKAADLDLTASPDLPMSPVTTEKPAETPKPVDPIGELKKHLFKLLATQFADDTDEQIAARMKVALKADNFKDFIIKYSPIEKAVKIGNEMVDAYLQENKPQRATETPQDAIVIIPEQHPQPPQTNVTVERSLATTGDTQWDVMKQQAAIMLSSGFMPTAIKSEAQILTIGMMGQALGIQPIVAINNINVIQGKPTVAPQLMLALIRRTGQLEDMKIEDDGTTCTVTMKRKNESAHVETFSMADAKAMQLDNKDNWRKQPKTMRKWRAISAAARIVFGDVIWGMYTPEEINPDAAFDDAA